MAKGGRYGNGGGGGGLIVLLCAILVYFMFCKKSKVNSLTHGILHIILAPFNVWACVSYGGALTGSTILPSYATALLVQLLFTLLNILLGLTLAVMLFVARNIFRMDAINNAYDPGRVRRSIVLSLWIMSLLMVLLNVGLCLADYFYAFELVTPFLWLGWFAFYAIFCVGTFIMTLRFYVRLRGKTTVLPPQQVAGPTITLVQPVYAPPAETVFTPVQSYVQAAPVEVVYASPDYVQTMPPEGPMQVVYVQPPVVTPANNPNAANLPVY